MAVWQLTRSVGAALGCSNASKSDLFVGTQSRGIKGPPIGSWKGSRAVVGYQRPARRFNDTLQQSLYGTQRASGRTRQRPCGSACLAVDFELRLTSCGSTVNLGLLPSLSNVFPWSRSMMDSFVRAQPTKASDWRGWTKIANSRPKPFGLNRNLSESCGAIRAVKL